MALAAAVQMNSNDSVMDNLAKAEYFVSQAAALGAKLILLPENFALMGKSETAKLEIAEHKGGGKIQDSLSHWAKKYKIWIVGGTIPMISDDPNKAFATTFVWDHHGKVVGRYNKIHLFDVKVKPGIEEYKESSTIYPGEFTQEHLQCIDSPIGKIGLSICYDLRFPELYRKLLEMGAEVFMLPAAFTRITGHAHWEVLLRARAIENVCYVVASAQVGQHPNGRETYGHSMIIDPWGKIIAEEKEGEGLIVKSDEKLKGGEGLIMEDIDLEYLHEIRSRLPVESHRKIK